MPDPKFHPQVRRCGVWLFFAWLVAVHACLSYFTLSQEVELWLLLLFWLLPLAVFFWFLRRFPLPERMGEREGGIPLPGWIWLGLLLAALGLRLVWFGNFPNWPLYDEMINGYFAMRLDQHWDWHPFFFWTQLPPFLIWALALLFKVIPSTLTAIRVLPFLLSVLILPLTYGSVRNFFPKSTSFLYLAVVSTGFGFLYFGRICHQGLLLLLWEFMVFYCVGKFMRTTTQSENSFWLVICGITIGTGFYTYFSWPVVGLMMTIPLLLKIREAPALRDKIHQTLLLGLPMIVVLIPIFLAVFNRSFGTYYSFMLNFGRHEPFGDYFVRVARLLSGFLWGYHNSIYGYGPSWGGFFNPLTGALLVTGFLVLPRRLTVHQCLWVYASALVFFSPNLLSAPPLSEMRVIQTLPLFAFVAVQGLEWVIETLPGKMKPMVLAVILLVSAGLDVVHLQKAREVVNGYWDFLKTQENAVAFPILEKEFRDQGPGILLTELNLSVFHDYSLKVACFPFNAEDHPEWNRKQVRWAALVVNVHYQPFLAQAFPEGKWYWLSRGVNPAQNDYNGGWMLGVLPFNDRTRRRVEDWARANGQLDDILRQFVELPIEPARKKAIQLMDALEPALSRDPLVRSCYWDIQFSLHNWDNMFGHPSPENFRASFRAMQMAVREGYPAAHFYNELGGFYLMEKKFPQAGKAFEQALHAPLNLTPAGENMSILRELEKTRKP